VNRKRNQKEENELAVLVRDRAWTLVAAVEIILTAATAPGSVVKNVAELFFPVELDMVTHKDLGSVLSATKAWAASPPFRFVDYAWVRALNAGLLKDLLAAAKQFSSQYSEDLPKVAVEGTQVEESTQRVWALLQKVQREKKPGR